MKIWIASDDSNLLGVGGVIVKNRQKASLRRFTTRSFYWIHLFLGI